MCDIPPSGPVYELYVALPDFKLNPTRSCMNAIYVHICSVGPDGGGIGPSSDSMIAAGRGGKAPVEKLPVDNADSVHSELENDPLYELYVARPDF